MAWDEGWETLLLKTDKTSCVIPSLTEKCLISFSQTKQYFSADVQCILVEAIYLKKHRESLNTWGIDDFKEQRGVL